MQAEKIVSLTGDLPSKDVSQQARGGQWNEIVHKVILAQLDSLPESIMALHFERDPKLEASYGARQKAFYLEDTRYNLESLAASILFETPQIFADYVVWLVDLLEARKIPTSGLGLHFECLREILHEVLPGDVLAQVDSYIDVGVQQLGRRAAKEE